MRNDNSMGTGHVIPVLPVNEIMVIDRVIDVYLWCTDMNTAEVRLLGTKLIDLADRRATDVELYYRDNRVQGNYPT